MFAGWGLVSGQQMLLSHGLINETEVRWTALHTG